MNFSDSEEEQLINYVALYPALYDSSHTNYRNNLIKENIWKDISKKINKTSELMFILTLFSFHGYIPTT